ncbi:MAG: pentapeptide repeat-containing protein [Synechococcaceae cyanobacterium ELA263]
MQLKPNGAESLPRRQLSPPECRQLLALIGRCIALLGHFCHADLRGANLSGANLSYADLRGSDLRGALTEGAQTNGTDLQDASLAGTSLAALID